MRQPATRLALIAALALAGCDGQIGLFDSTIKPEVTGNGPHEPVGFPKERNPSDPGKLPPVTGPIGEGR